jgi:hypothetical protein
MVASVAGECAGVNAKLFADAVRRDHATNLRPLAIGQRHRRSSRIRQEPPAR